MAIDSETKRRSLIAMPGMTTPPVPDATIDRFDRRHVCDVPATILTSTTAPFKFWRKVSNDVPTDWVRETDTPPGG